MKTVSKKLLSLLLVAILLVSALPFQAFAEDLEGSDGTPVVLTDDPSGDNNNDGNGGNTNNSNDAGARTTTVPHDENDRAHVSEVWFWNQTTHWQQCPVANCEKAGQHLNELPHSFDGNGVCTVCKYACEHTATAEKDSTGRDPDCIHAGQEKDTVCTNCGKLIKTGDVIPATGIHNYVNGICSVCGAVQIGGSYKLTLDANGGTINGGSSLIIDVTQGQPVALPTPIRPNHTFVGWYVDDTELFSNGATYKYSTDKTAKAKWTEVTYQLTVRRVLNGNNSTAKTIKQVNVPAGVPLLDYLNANVKADIRAELSVTPGYTWQGNFWRDYSGTQPLTDQAAIMNQAQTVFVNFVSTAYTIYFSAEGGTVTPLSKTVYFGRAVGTLPTATKSGKVFKGWQDANGTIYDSTTVYKIAGDTSLTAIWEDEVMVVLYIYVNGNFTSCDRMILMDKYVKNDNISRADVVTEIAKHYSAINGYNLSVAGLFDESTWASYRANTGKAGVDNIGITGTHPNKIYVMVNNAQSGTTILPTNPTTTPTIPNNGNAYWVVTGPNTGYWVQSNGSYPQGSYWVSTGNGNGYWSYNPSNYPTTVIYPTYVPVPGSNPKTGDTAQLEVAAAVMILAAAALVTMMALRKKRA